MPEQLRLPLDGDEPNVAKPKTPAGTRIRETMRFTGTKAEEKPDSTKESTRPLRE